VISADDKVILWAGGVYDWFDPLTLIRAIGQLRDAGHPVRLVFLGMKHPNPEVGKMDIATATRELSDALGLTDKHVFFNTEWVEYADRHNWLLDADCGVTTHYDHLETTFAFRTRVLDYLWAGLPIVTTTGDALAELVCQRELGIAVEPEDPHALAAALEKVLFDEDFAARCVANIAAIRPEYSWQQVLTPLLTFLRNPRPAADRLLGGELTPAPTLPFADRVKKDIGLVKEYLSAGGPKEVASRAAGRIVKVLRKGR
jgi:glycosyltransferase involved in cell wall biosynthesis